MYIYIYTINNYQSIYIHTHIYRETHLPAAIAIASATTPSSPVMGHVGARISIDLYLYYIYLYLALYI